MNVESIAEVKVLTQGYQAEYGRSSGLQITAVTKSGTNQFRGSAYDIQRNSDWNANTWVNEQERRRQSRSRTTKTLGYTLGGPVGKPGGNNKLFFFYATSIVRAQRDQRGNTIRFRVPTALERDGDFSQTLDNNGALFNLIRDPQLPLPCTATTPPAASRTAASSAGFRRTALRPGLSDPEPLPAAEPHAGAGTNYNYEVAAPPSKT